MKVTMTRAATKAHRRRVCRVMPNRKTVRAKSVPVRNSTMGDCQEMRCPQLRHCPMRKRKLSIGMLSYALMAVRQLGHREPGMTILSPLGIRWMHTLQKLPTTRPSRRLDVISTGSLIDFHPKTLQPPPDHMPN